MNKFLSTAISLPDFSPSLGHTYMPPPSSNRLKALESQLDQTSKEATPLPDALSSKKAPLAPNTNSYMDGRLLEETLNITLKYGNEYMDENPITGQPGDFHLSTTGRDKDRPVMPLPNKTPTVATAKPGASPMAKLVTDIPPPRKGSKSDKSPKTPGGGVPKPKRRKSKALGPGGTSPR
jgi:mediator of RNA polymerase II transcription subunit 6